MTAMSVVERMTAEEFLAMPYREDQRWVELVGGELVVNEPRIAHEYVRSELLRELTNWAHAADGRGRAFGPIDVQITDHDVYAPDILWYRPGRVPPRGAYAPHAVPDLAVEVRSPGTWRYDIGAKKSGYERAGLPELWLVDTAATGTVFAFRRSRPEVPSFDIALELTRDETLSSPLLPGFALKLAAVFGE